MKEEKKTQPKAKAADHKAVKGKSAIGKKRTYADKEQSHEDVGNHNGAVKENEIKARK